MRVRFYESGGTERIAIHTGFDGKDEVHRDVSEKDRHRYAAEYAVFRPPPVVVAAVVESPPVTQGGLSVKPFSRKR